MQPVPMQFVFECKFCGASLPFSFRGETARVCREMAAENLPPSAAPAFLRMLRSEQQRPAWLFRYEKSHELLQIDQPIAKMRLKLAGEHTARVTPVPIPNTEVKPRRADGTARVRVWEIR